MGGVEDALFEVVADGGGAVLDDEAGAGVVVTEAKVGQDMDDEPEHVDLFEFLF